MTALGNALEELANHEGTISFWRPKGVRAVEVTVSIGECRASRAFSDVCREQSSIHLIANELPELIHSVVKCAVHA